MEYIELRNTMAEINTKILSQDINNSNYLIQSAKYMGLDTDGNKIIFENEAEKEAYWDFLVYEKINNKESLFTNSTNNDILTEREIKLIDNIKVYDTGLYWVGNSYNNIINIVNTKTGENFNLHDINLSKYKLSGCLIFLRLLNIENYFMTSGFSFIFCDDVNTVLRREKYLCKKEYKLNESITKFRVIVKLNRLYGNIVEYKEV